jgi:hypothetical protein
MDNGIEGGCRCGQVRFRATKPPLLTMACHCRGCQQMTASAFSLSAAIPADAFEIIAGEPVVGGLHGPSRHFMCPHCLSWMFTRPEGIDGFVNVRSVLFDRAEWSEPFLETWTSEALDWARTPAVHSFETFPPMDAYEGLIAGYAATRVIPA